MYLKLLFLATLEYAGFKKYFVLERILSRFTFGIDFNCEWIVTNFAALNLHARRQLTRQKWFKLGQSLTNNKSVHMIILCIGEKYIFIGVLLTSTMNHYYSMNQTDSNTLSSTRLGFLYIPFLPFCGKLLCVPEFLGTETHK